MIVVEKSMEKMGRWKGKRRERKKEISITNQKRNKNPFKTSFLRPQFIDLNLFLSPPSRQLRVYTKATLMEADASPKLKNYIDRTSINRRTSKVTNNIERYRPGVFASIVAVMNWLGRTIYSSSPSYASLHPLAAVNLVVCQPIIDTLYNSEREKKRRRKVTGKDTHGGRKSQDKSFDNCEIRSMSKFNPPPL